MGKIISSGLAKPDDPMFTRGFETFVVRKPVPAPTAPETKPSNSKQQDTIAIDAKPSATT